MAFIHNIETYILIEFVQETDYVRETLHPIGGTLSILYYFNGETTLEMRYVIH